MPKGGGDGRGPDSQDGYHDFFSAQGFFITGTISVTDTCTSIGLPIAQ